MTYLNLLLIGCILVFIIDISGVVDSIKRGLSWLITKGRIVTEDFSLKPFECSLCMTFWCGLLYLLVIGEFTIVKIAFVCLIAYGTKIIKSILYLLGDVLISIINKIEDRL